MASSAATATSPGVLPPHDEKESAISSIAATAKRMFFFISINSLGLDD
jgi:hypothetical protein